MPFAGKADVTFDKVNSIIICGDSTHNGIALQDAFDAIREWEDDLAQIDILPTDGTVASILVGSGKEGLGLGATRPITMVIHAPWVIQAGDHTAAPLDLFTFDGGTLISDEEAADQANPRLPYISATSVSGYDRVKGQEGKFITSPTFDVMSARELGEHITDPVAGKVIIRDTINQMRWEALAWEDAAGTIPYTGNGLEKVDQLVQVAWS